MPYTIIRSKGIADSNNKNGFGNNTFIQTKDSQVSNRFNLPQKQCRFGHNVRRAPHCIMNDLEDIGYKVINVTSSSIESELCVVWTLHKEPL